MEFDTQKALKALADPNRFHIISQVAQKEEGVFAQELLETLSITQPTLSHHMKTLVESGLVDCAEEGRWRRYSLNKENCAAFLSALSALLAAK